MLEINVANNVPRDTNLLNYKNWVVGVPHFTPFSALPFGFAYGQPNEYDSRMVDAVGPFNKRTPIRRGVVSEFSITVAGGLWHDAIPIDNTKNYRLSFWLNIRQLGLNSHDTSCINFGVDTFSGQPNVNDYPRSICHKTSIGGSGDSDNNAYFTVVNYNQLPQNEWLLFVGYILNKDEPANGALTQHVLQTFGIYRENGEHISHADLADYRFGLTAPAYRNVYKFSPTATHMYLRAFTNPVRSVGDTMDFVYPRIDLMDGREPSVGQLARGLDVRLGVDL